MGYCVWERPCVREAYFRRLSGALITELRSRNNTGGVGPRACADPIEEQWRLREIEQAERNRMRARAWHDRMREAA